MISMGASLKTRFTVVLSFLLLCIACSDKSNDPDNPDASEPTLSISSDVREIEFSADGFTATANGIVIKPVFTIKTNQAPWNIKITPSGITWCRVELSGDSFTISVIENVTDKSPESATVSISAGKADPITIKVTQKANSNTTKPVLSISPAIDMIEFSADGLTAMANGNIIKPVFKVLTNQADWTAKVTPANATWCSVHSAGDSITLSVIKNITGNSPVPATIIISAGNAEPVTITVTQKENKAPDIYILSVETMNNKSIYKWWKNDHSTAINTINSGQTLIKDMFVSNGNVYFTGHQKSGSDWKAFYNKNGSRTMLNYAGSTDVIAKSIAVWGEDVYVAGETYVNRKDPNAVTMATTGVYWKNGHAQRLKDVDNNIYLTGIAARENKVCISGYEFKNIDTWGVAKYWENGQEITLGDPAYISYAEGITIADNGDVHVVGYGYYGSGDSRILKGHWWVNGQLKQSFDKYMLMDVTVSGNDTYIVGYDSSSGNSVCYKNGVNLELKNAERTYACSISVLNDDIYVAGSESFRSFHKAVYWINGNRFYLTDGIYSSGINTIFVTE